MTDSVMSDGATILASRPQVRSDLLISRELDRGPDRVHLVKIRGGKAFEVAVKEHFLLSRLDGQRSLTEIGEEYAARFGRRLGPAQWSQLLWLLHQRDLLRPTGRPETPAAGMPEAGSAVAAPRVLDRLAAALGWVFSVPSGVVIGVGLLAMYGTLAAAAPGLWRAAAPAFSDWRYLVGIAAISYLSAMLHELAHGVAAAHFGCRVIRLNLLAFSCRVEDYQYLPARAHQVTIAAAGGVSNSLVIVPFVLAWQATPADSAGHRFAAAVVVVGAVQSLVNFVPIVPLDGYKMLSHQVGMVALAEESRRYLWSRPRSWLTRRGPRYPRRARMVLGLYGMAWHAMLAGAGAAIAYGVGHLLRPHLGQAGYAASAAAVVLTVTLWLASRPRRPARAAPTQQTPHHQRTQ